MIIVALWSFFIFIILVSRAFKVPQIYHLKSTKNLCSVFQNVLKSTNLYFATCCCKQNEGWLIRTAIYIRNLTSYIWGFNRFQQLKSRASIIFLAYLPNETYPSNCTVLKLYLLFKDHHKFYKVRIKLKIIKCTVKT